MPYDTTVISIFEAENLMANAPWIERYLVGVAYSSFARPRVSPDYHTLDQLTPVSEMPTIVHRLNDELQKLGFKQRVEDSYTMPILIYNLRGVLKGSDRANALDWLVGNVNETYFEEAIKQKAWGLRDKELFAFCEKLVATRKGHT